MCSSDLQKLGVVALPYTSMFTLSNTAVTCWVCFPSPVLMSSIYSKAEAWGCCSPLYFDAHVVAVVIDWFVGVGVGVGGGVGVAFTLSHTAVTCWVCSPSPVL